MSRTPKTLFQLAGLAPEPARFSDSVVVVIDAQREYVDGLLPLEGVEPALAAIGRLLEGARAAGAPVFHVAHRGRPGSGGPFDPETDGYAFADPAVPVAGEHIVEKGLPNAFAGTGLIEAVRATGRDRLILAGFMTHMCISTTARAALDLGLRSVVVADATATRALPDATGGEALPAHLVHRAALAEIADRFAFVVNTADITA